MKRLQIFKSGSILAVVASVIITVTGCQTVTKNYDNAKARAREDALATALKYMRQAIRDYTHDHGKPPRQLQDLVTSGYFNSIPIDPITTKPDWTVEFHRCNPPSPCEQLIKDVHSVSAEISSKNTPYSQW
jgi:type II secretory pathway pseudopilin PulG